MDNSQTLYQGYVDIKPLPLLPTSDINNSLISTSQSCNTSCVTNPQSCSSFNLPYSSPGSFNYTSSFRRPIPQQYSTNSSSSNAFQSSVGVTCAPYSGLPSSVSTVPHPQSFTFFPTTTYFSPPLSPPLITAPLSYPLYQQQTIQNYQNPQFFPNTPFQDSKQQLITNTSSQITPYQQTSSSSCIAQNSENNNAVSNIKLQNEDDILNDAIQAAVSESTISSPEVYQSECSSVYSSSSDASMTHQKTVFEETLSTIDDVQLSSYLNTHFIRPDSVKKKMHWTAKMFKTFCERLNTQMFPLNGRVVGAFLHMLAHDCRYAITSLSNVIYPSLVHLQQDAGFESDPTESAIIRAKLKSLQLDPHVKKEGKGKEPLCWFDVLELIKRIPDSFGSKDMEASLFLFALQTGSRACTCGAITWGDIINYEFDETTGASRIIILQRVTKGNQQWNHKVKLEGFINTPNNGDFLYFLERHTQKTLKVSIRQVAKGEISETIKSEKVWNLSLAAMRERLKMRLSQAGFPDSLFSFHSFRSGFICSSLLLAGKDPGQQGSVLDHTAFVAGWIPYGRAQKRYVKSVAEVMIVASRLVGAGLGLRNTNEVDQTNHEKKEVHVIESERKRNSSQYNNNTNESIIIIEKSSTESRDSNHPITITSSNVQAASVGFIQTPTSIEEFHNFVLKPPQFGAQGMLNTVKFLFNQRLGLTDQSTEDQKRLCNNAWIRALSSIGKTSLLNKGRSKTTWHQNRQEGHDIIEHRLLEDNDPPDTIAEDLYQTVKDYYNIEHAPPKLFYNIDRHHIEPKERPMLTDNTGKQVRTRLRWTENENTLLLNYYQENHSFANITSVLPDRTTSDAWSHHRHLQSKSKKSSSDHEIPNDQTKVN